MRDGQTARAVLVCVFLQLTNFSDIMTSNVAV